MLSQHVCQTVIINASGSNNAEQCSSKQQHIGLRMFESISVAAVLPQSCTHSVFASNKFKSGGTQYWQKLHNLLTSQVMHHIDQNCLIAYCVGLNSAVVLASCSEC